MRCAGSQKEQSTNSYSDSQVPCWNFKISINTWPCWVLTNSNWIETFCISPNLTLSWYQSLVLWGRGCEEFFLRRQTCLWAKCDELPPAGQHYSGWSTVSDGLGCSSQIWGAESKTGKKDWCSNPMLITPAKRYFVHSLKFLGLSM